MRNIESIRGKIPCVKVYVGYGWAKFDEEDKKLLQGHEVLADEFWQTLKSKFERKSIKVQAYAENINVRCNRLRGTHGLEVWSTVCKKIKEADILIFDVAKAINLKMLDNLCEDEEEDLTKKIKSFNSNVLVEIGVALGCGKRVLLLCPENLFKKIPSDLKGYLWTVYTLAYGKNGMIRKFADEYGLNAAYNSMLRSAAYDKLKELGMSTDGDEDEEA